MPKRQADSVRLAEQVFEAAFNAAELYWYLLGYCDPSSEWWPRIDYGDSVKTLEGFTKTGGKWSDAFRDLAEQTAALGTLFFEVADWWVADQPPSIGPDCTSLVECILQRAARMLACVTHAHPGSDAVTLTYIASYCHPLDFEGLLTSLHCEATTMSFRRPIGPKIRSFLAKNWEGQKNYSEMFVSQLKETCGPSLAHDWLTMSDQQRVEWIKLVRQRQLDLHERFQISPNTRGVRINQLVESEQPAATIKPSLKRRPGRRPNPPDLVAFIVRLRELSPTPSWQEVADHANQQRAGGRSNVTPESARKIYESATRKLAS